MNDSLSFVAGGSGRFFIKMQGLRNHFVIVDGRTEPYAPDEKTVVRICDLQIGVGGDQLVIIEPPTEVGRAAGAVGFMRLLNVDGKEVEACGNATRCVAWLLLEEASVDRLKLETLAGIIDCERRGERRVSCDMGPIRSGWDDIPLAGPADTQSLDFGIESLGPGIALNIGNPHVVFFVEDLDAVDIERHAPLVQKHALFPQQVNVGFAQRVNDAHLRLVVYERGAGLTMACGSGACVAAYAAQTAGKHAGAHMTVSMPAGDIQVDLVDGPRAIMTGSVDFCFSGYLPNWHD